LTRPSSRHPAAALAGFWISAALAACSADGTGGHRSGSAAGTPAASVTTVRRGTYADGTYTATGVYGNLPSSIGVTVTLHKGLITAVRVTPHATNPTSRDLQDRFAEAIPALVVGKPIDDVRVSRVAGSSGTPIGFNDAIEKIKAQAAH
jgi:uncharacterized protein with FMN-binding domain